MIAEFLMIIIVSKLFHLNCFPYNGVFSFFKYNNFYDKLKDIPGFIKKFVS